MWLFTQNGFYSTVKYEPAKDHHPTERTQSLRSEGSELLLVRTRDEGDMQRLVEVLPQVESVQTDKADYLFRAVVSADEWLGFLEHETRNLDYTNFKNRVTETLGRQRHDMLMEVWSTMRRLQR
jgi:hypothetical protein